MHEAQPMRIGSGRRIFATVAAAFLASMLFGGCGDDQGAPTRPPSPSPAGSSSVTLDRLDLAGPTTVALGQAGQFTVTGHYSNGSTRDVTGEVSWQTNPSVLRMSTPGRFAGAGNGETSLTARLGARFTVINSVIVVPEGTYRLTGTIRDEGIRVRDARVFIEDQALGRTTAVTIDGEYRVYGVAGATRITVTKEGYQAAVKDQVIASHQAVDFDLVLSRPRDELAGRYTVTFAAAPGCDDLPEEARVRSYQATLLQTGPTLTVVLEGEHFVTLNGSKHNRFSGTHEGDVVRFVLSNTWFDYYRYFSVLPDILEQVSPGLFFSVEGWTLASISSQGFSGMFNGAIGVYSTSFGIPAIARCPSTNHQLSIVK